MLGVTRLVQEDFSGDPYKIFVSTMLLVRTRAAQVQKVCPTLFRKYPSVQDLARARGADLQRILRPLGLYRTRTRHLRKFAQRIVAQGFPMTREEAEGLPYVGPYVADAYAILVLKDYSVRPRDRELQAYLQQLRR